jgi:glycosyltransferase involved in cell wall biosynthesis
VEESRPIRVLLVSSHPVQYAAPLYRLYSQDPRLDVTVAYCSLQGAEPGVDPEFGVEIAWDIPLLEGYRWVHPPNRSPRPGLDSFFGVLNPGLWGLVRRGQFHAVVLYTGWRYASFWIAVAAAKLAGAKVLFGTDATGLASRDGRRWKAALKARVLPAILRLADVAIAPSSGTYTFFESLGVPPNKIVVTPFVVDNEWWTREAAASDVAKVRTEWGVPEDGRVLLFSGKLQPWKRPQDVLEAFAQLPAQVYLVFAGDGPQRGALEEMARQKGVASRVRFLGFVNQSRLPAIYAASDLCVLPSSHEPCAVAVIEAMVCGCVPVVSTEVWRGRKDVVEDGRTGFVFPTGDVEALAQRLREALADEHKLGKIREAARQRMKTWSPRENLRALIRALGLAVEGGET